MSETTKIDKVRVNGVLYDLGGSGSGGVSGLYTAPLDLLEADYTGFQKATIDPMELVQQLQKSGINTNEPPIMDSEEEGVVFNIADVRLTNLNNNSNMALNTRSLSGAVNDTPLIKITLHRSYSNYYDMKVYVLGNCFGPMSDVAATSKSFESIIIDYFSTKMDYYVELPNHNPDTLGYIINSILVDYGTVDTEIKYYISNLTEFCEKVFVEYNSGSDSGIVFNNVGDMK